MTYRYYYRYNPERISACPLTVHALLHIADSIAIAGPVWAYWAFPMERYCGKLLPAIKSRRFPYSNLSNRISDIALIRALELVYDLDLSYKIKRPLAKKTFSTPECEFLPSRELSFD
jgi:hypothetical protein